MHILRLLAGCLWLVLFTCGCDVKFEKKSYQIASIHNLEDINKEYSVDITRDDPIYFTFHTGITNAEIPKTATISISIVNRSDRVQRFLVTTNHISGHRDLKSGDSVEVYNGPLLHPNGGNWWLLKEDSRCTFRFRLSGDKPILPMTIGASVIPNYP